jgi:hypothetical protein
MQGAFFCLVFKKTHRVSLVSAMEWLTFFWGFILQVHIVCRLHHDQLKPVFHVCRRLQQAVSRAFWYVLYFWSFFCNPTVLLEYLTMMCRKSATGNHRCADKMPFAACAFFLSLSCEDYSFKIQFSLLLSLLCQCFLFFYCLTINVLYAEM